jgi:hypothetical protein
VLALAAAPPRRAGIPVSTPAAVGGRSSAAETVEAATTPATTTTTTTMREGRGLGTAAPSRNWKDVVCPMGGPHEWEFMHRGGARAARHAHQHKISARARIRPSHFFVLAHFPHFSFLQ